MSKPALSPEEWAELFGPPVIDADFKNRLEQMRSWAADETGYGGRGTAAICLYGRPEGFTHEDVKDLRWVATEFVVPETGASARLLALADRIAALLPPEGS